MRPIGYRTAHVALVVIALGAAQGARQTGDLSPRFRESAEGKALLDRLPLNFEPVENGQRFVAHGLREHVVVSPRGLSFQPISGVRTRSGLLRPATPIRMQLRGRLAGGALKGAGPLPGKINRLYGRDRSAWKTGISTYAQVRQPGVFPGIDLVYYGNQKTLEYDFVVGRAADPSRIRLGFEAGAQPAVVVLEPSGDLSVGTDAGQLRLHKPLAYQEAEGRRQPVPCEYLMAANGDVSFRLGAYDHSRELVIDPQLTFSSYVGGSGLDSVYGIATDSAGNLFLAGSTNSPDFSHLSAQQPALAGGFDAFVLKAVPTNGGYALAYSTYLGGANSDSASAVGVDASGYAYVYGSTASADFPTQNALQDQLNGSGLEGIQDAFLLKLTSSGNALVYSTYIGGSQDESVPGGGGSLAVTSAGQAYITGNTRSTDFPGTDGSYRETIQGGEDIFVGVLAADGQSGFTTLIGGLSSQPEEGLGIAVDRQGNVYVCGDTQNADFPTTAGAVDGSYGGEEDAFVAKLRPDLTGLVYSTYLGGTSIDQANAICVDAAGFAYVAGFTGSANYPVTPGAFQTAFHGPDGLDRDAFLTKLDRAGNRLAYSTFLGGTSYEIAYALQVDRLGSAVVGGFTFEAGFPVVLPIQAANAGDADGFVTRFLNTGATVGFSTLIGGALFDGVAALALGPDGAYYLGGTTYSTDFPQVGAGGSRGENSEGFVARISDLQSSMGKAATPKSVAVGTVKLGATKTKKVKIKNTGKEVLYGMVGLPASPFAVGAGAGSFALAPKKSLTIEVQFAPPAKGSFTGTLPISTSDALHGQINLPLSGKGK